jgi:predicted nucleic-acid-binding Zn-ribbon protein
MALIKCSECGNDVSSKATACPKCGNPIAAAGELAATGTTVTTVQATAKKFKGQQLIAIVVTCFGLLMMFGSGGRELWPGVIALAGLVWYLIARTSAWWHHG